MFGAIHGVIHTAGILGQGLSQTKTVAQVEPVFGPKVKGTEILTQTLKETQLDFLILCSSLSALSPIIGQIDYSAANAFLDAFAFYNTHHNNQLTLSINWGVWQALGMIEQAAISQEAKDAITAEIETKGWTKAGVQAFHQILTGCTSPQIIVSPKDFRPEHSPPLRPLFRTGQTGFH